MTPNPDELVRRNSDECLQQFNEVIFSLKCGLTLIWTLAHISSSQSGNFHLGLVCILVSAAGISVFFPRWLGRSIPERPVPINRWEPSKIKIGQRPRPSAESVWGRVSAEAPRPFVVRRLIGPLQFRPNFRTAKKKEKRAKKK
jgi:hypothetical protein